MADTVKLSACASSTVLGPMAASTGGWFTAPTVMTMVSASEAGGVPLSVTVKVTGKLPAWVKPGVHENVRVVGLKLAPVGSALVV